MKGLRTMMSTTHRPTQPCIMCGLPTTERVVVMPSPNYPQFGMWPIRYPLCRGCDADLVFTETLVAAMDAYVKAQPLLQRMIELSRRYPCFWAAVEGESREAVS